MKKDSGSGAIVCHGEEVEEFRQILDPHIETFTLWSSLIVFPTLILADKLNHTVLYCWFVTKSQYVASNFWACKNLLP